MTSPLLTWQPLDQRLHPDAIWRWSCWRLLMAIWGLSAMQPRRRWHCDRLRLTVFSLTWQSSTYVEAASASSSSSSSSRDLLDADKKQQIQSWSRPNRPIHNKKDGYRQLNVRQLGSLRPWYHRGKCIHGSKENLMLVKRIAACTHLSSTIFEI